MKKKTTFPYDVFVSYRWVNPDQLWVQEQLVPALKRAGLKVLLDVEDFVPGRDLILEMSRAGSESRQAICVLSPDYFEGNRMAAFESLMLRRSDPSGKESRLIPLIIRETSLPEWIRGLIPITWTRPKYHLREWRKLLKVLEAKNLDAAAPIGIQQISEDDAPGEKLSEFSVPQVSIVSVSKLSPRAGDGLGYDVLLKNDSFEEMFVNSTEISGVVAMRFRGITAAVLRVIYEVQLDSSVADSISSDGFTPLKGNVYDSSSLEWGTHCQGVLRHEADTSLGLKLWKYSLSIPTMVRLPPKDRVFLRVLYKRGTRSIIEQKGGYPPASTTMGISHSEHNLAVKLESSETLTAIIDDEFLKLIANWPD